MTCRNFPTCLDADQDCNSECDLRAMADETIRELREYFEEEADVQ